MDLILHDDHIFTLSHSRKEEEKFSSLARLFSKNTAAGLLALLDHETLQQESRSLQFWKSFTHSCLKDYCLTREQAEIPAKASTDFEPLVQKAPYMKGAEYLNTGVLSDFHKDIQKELSKRARSYESPEAFLKEKYPSWLHMGKCFFHLAENPEEDSSNFVFLATYASRMNDRKRLQHLTFGKALEDFLEKKNYDSARKILEPLHKASEKSLFVKKLLDSKKIYAPTLLSNKEAQDFLADYPFFEEAGIQVKLPQSWEGKKPSQPKVTLTLEEEEEKQSFVSFHQLFRFRPRLTLDGKSLNADEVSKILESEEGLIKIRGRWLDVNREKLERVLSHWEKARMLEDQGLSFVEALRILSKGFLNLKKTGLEEGDEEVIETEASQNLQKLIDSLKNSKKFEINGFEKVLETHLKAKLRPYQEEGVRWLYFLRQYELGGGLCDDMGLGKTIQVISSLLLAKHLLPSPSFPSLIIAPASLLGNWASEIKKFAPNLRFQVLHPSFGVSREEMARFENSLSHYDVLITSYQRVEKIHWLSSVSWSFLILDEAQAIKNPETKQTKEIKSLRASCQIALTGTPIENKILDLWSLFDFSFPGLLGNLLEFKEFYQRMRQKESFEPLKAILKPYLLRRLKTDKSIIKDLPEKIEKKVYCFLTETQVRLYKETLAELSKKLKKEEEESKRSGLILSYLMKFKQICNHPSQYLSDNVYDELDSGKFRELKRIAEMVAARGEKLLVFTQFKEITDILEDFLGKIFAQKGFVIHGGIPPHKRKEYVDLFQNNPSYPFFILSLKAGGSGLNLTAANHVIHFDRWWNPAVERQASDRSYRIGQKKNVLIYKFLTKGTLEENINAMIEDKEKLTEEIVETSSLKFSELSNEDVLKLVTLDTEGKDLEWK